jgi:hypothetical protein
VNDAVIFPDLEEAAANCGFKISVDYDEPPINKSNLVKTEGEGRCVGKVDPDIVAKKAKSQ